MGMFDIKKLKFMREKVSDAGIDPSFLPEVTKKLFSTRNFQRHSGSVYLSVIIRQVSSVLSRMKIRFSSMSEPAPRFP